MAQKVLVISSNALLEADRSGDNGDLRARGLAQVLRDDWMFSLPQISGLVVGHLPLDRVAICHCDGHLFLAAVEESLRYKEGAVLAAESVLFEVIRDELSVLLEELCEVRAQELRSLRRIGAFIQKILQNKASRIGIVHLNDMAQNIGAAPARFNRNAPLGGEVEEKLGWAEVSSHHGVVDERPILTLSRVDEVCTELVDQPVKRQAFKSETNRIWLRMRDNILLGDIVVQLDIEEIQCAKARQGFLPEKGDACDEGSDL